MLRRASERTALTTHPSGADLPSTKGVRWLRATAVLGVLGLLAMISPWLARLARAGLSLLVLSMCLLALLLLLQTIPYGAAWLERWILRRRVRQARAHPIEQRAQAYMARSEELARARGGLAAMGAQIASLEQMLAGQRNAPAEVRTRADALLAQMREAYATLAKQLQTQSAALAMTKQQLAVERMEVKFAEAARQAAADMRPRASEAFVTEWLDDEAREAIQHGFNLALSELETEVRSLTDTQERAAHGRLSAGHGPDQED